MRLLLVLTLVFSVCALTAAQTQTQPCKSPPYLTGRLFVDMEGGITFWNYDYNTALQRMRIFETENLANRSFTYQYLLYFGESVMYEIDGLTSTCSKRPLRTDYQPIGIPEDATFLGNWVCGSLSVPNAGLTINTWLGYTQQGEKYSKAVTEVGCVPDYTIFHTEKHGKVIIVFGNSTMHMTTPDDLSPPHSCPDENAPAEGNVVDLMGLFSESKARNLRRALGKLKNVYLKTFSVL